MPQISILQASVQIPRMHLSLSEQSSSTLHCGSSCTENVEITRLRMYSNYTRLKDKLLKVKKIKRTDWMATSVLAVHCVGRTLTHNGSQRCRV